MKKLTFVTIALSSLFISCAQLMPQRNLGQSSGIQGASRPVLIPQETFYLSDNGVAYVMDIISETVNQDQKRPYTLRPDGFYETYLGEYLQLPLDRGNSLKLISPTNINSYELFMQGNTLFFRTIYQDTYRIGVYENNMLVREITVNNKLKYQFTEPQIYDIILKNYNNKDLKRTQDAATLYRIAYPNGPREREITLELLELAALNGNKALFDEEYNILLKKYTLTNDEVLRILESQRRVTGGSFRINPRFLTYRNDNYGYNEQIKNLILSKGRPSQQEVAFLEQYNLYNPSPQLAEMIGNYKQGAYEPMESQPEDLLPDSGRILEESLITGGTQPAPVQPAQPSKPAEPHLTLPGQQAIPKPPVATSPKPPVVTMDQAAYGEFQNNFSSGKSAFTQENYNEAIIFLERALNVKGTFPEKGEASFYLGQSYANLGNYKRALDYYNKALGTARNRGEILYNMGVAYHEVGNVTKSKEVLNQVKMDFPDTIWSRKSTIYLMKLN